MADEDLLSGLEDEVTDDAGIDPEPSVTEPEPPEETVDPRDARLDQIEATLARLGALDPNKINPALGRIGAIQSALDGLSKRDPIAELDPRVSAAEEVVIALARTVSNSALIEDEDKASLRAALRGIENAKSDRDLERKVKALTSQTASIVEKVADETPDPMAALWNAASEEVRDMASEYGVTPAQIPWNEIQRGAQNNPAKVARVALKWFEANKPDPAVDRVIERRRNAGSGSPAREGAANSLENDKTRLMEQGIPITDEAARKRIAASLGLEL